MIPEFLQDLLHQPEDNVYSTDIGVYVVASSFQEARDKIEAAVDEEVFELLAVKPVVLG